MLYLVFSISITALVAFTIGWYANNRFGNSYKKQMKLKFELDNTKKELQSYQNDVTEYFGQTSELLNNLSKQYKTIVDHIQGGSKQLCKELHNINPIELEQSIDGINKLTPSHNWHPTYLEASQAKSQNKKESESTPSNSSIKMLKTDNEEPLLKIVASETNE